MNAQKATEFVTLKQYLSWAVGEGCTVKTGFTVIDAATNAEIDIIVVTEPSSGKYAVIPGLDEDESLPAHAYTQYDRRLGLTSPFGKTKH